MSYPFIDCRAKQSWPGFWIAGSLTGIIFVIIGTYSLRSYFTGGALSNDRNTLPTAAAFLIMGILLIAGVIVTMKIMADPDDLSFKVDVKKDFSKKSCRAQKLANYLDVGHNNVLLFDTEEGQMKIFGYRGRFVVEADIKDNNGFKTFHLTDPNVNDTAPVFIINIFFEKFPVRMNRVVNKAKVVEVIQKLYGSRSLFAVISALPFADTSEETEMLIRKDAFITPAVPFVIPKKQKDIDAYNIEKEDREKRAFEELLR